MCPDGEELEQSGQLDQHIQPDETQRDPLNDDDQASIDGGSNRSSLTSLTESVLKGKMEGGRTYAVYGKEEYGLPMDDAELDRIDMCHAKYYALLNKKRYFAPITDPQRILDLGCGTGIWCIDVAEEFPSAQVIGTDIAPTQPEWVPPNCQFELDDIEKPWTWKEGSFDFIFSRDLILAIRDWPGLIDQCYRHLKPGGWIEFHCITGILACDDNSLPKDSAFQKFSDTIEVAAEKWGSPIDAPTHWKEWFEDRGFVNVGQAVPKLPCNPWPRDPRMKLLGAWEMENLLGGVEGMVRRLFQKSLGWTEAEFQVFIAMLRKDIRNPQYHTYWPFYIVYAQKPEDAGQEE